MVGPRRENYEILKEICEQHYVRRLDLHGSSWAEDDSPANPSELNFLVEYLPHDENELWEIHCAMEEALQKLFSGKEVSLLRADDIRPDFLRRMITRRRTQVYSVEGRDRS